MRILSFINTPLLSVPKELSFFMATERKLKCELSASQRVKKLEANKIYIFNVMFYKISLRGPDS